MTQRRRDSHSSRFRLLSDAALLFVWIPQAFVLCCLLIYGHIPIPRDWIHAQLEQQNTGDFRIEAEAYQLRFDGTFEARGLSVYHKEIEESLFEAEFARLGYRLTPTQGLLKVDEVVIAKGTLHVPAVFAPNGQRTTLLDRIAVDLELEDGDIHLRSICARHEDVSIRGALRLSPKAFATDRTSEEATSDNPLNAFYQAAARGLSIREKYHFFNEPTLRFEIDARTSDTVQIDALLTSSSVQHESTRLDKLSIDLSSAYTNGVLSFTAPTIIKTEQLDAPDYRLRARNLSCQITEDDWEQILAKEWPTLELSAQHVHAYETRIDAPFFKLWKATENVVGIEGSAEGLKGAVNITGAFDRLEHDGWLDLTGNLDLYELLPADIKQRLPDLVFNEAPHYHVDLDFNPGFALGQATFDIEIPSVEVDGITFDQLLTRGQYRDGLTEIHELRILRAQQDIGARIRHDRATGALDLLVKGRLNPQDYNTLLPRWWEKTFKPFTIDEQSRIDADFIVQTNLKERRTHYFHGSVDLSEIDYKGVPIQQGRVSVRGTPRHIEIAILEAAGPEGDFSGTIGISMRPDGISSPVALHLETQLELSQQATKNLLGEVTYDRIVGDTVFAQAPFVTVQGVSYFKKHYPEFTGKSYYVFSADSKGPLTYNTVPLDHLTVSGYADDSITQLRQLNFGYASGRGTAELDIIDQGQDSDLINVRASLNGADESRAIANLPILDDIEDDLTSAATEANASTALSEPDGVLNVTLHTLGPINDPFASEGFGNFTIRDREIGTIRMLGPLSRIVGFTAFELDTLSSDFVLRERTAFFPSLRVDGPRTQINASGSMTLEQQEIDMRVTVRLFGNTTKESNPIHRITSVINPLAMLLRFNVSGTLDEQKIRSTYDPRNLLPGSKK